MENEWGDKYTTCPWCKELVRREDLDKGTHVCWNRDRPPQWFIEVIPDI